MPLAPGAWAGFVNDGENVLLETDSGGSTQVAYTLEPALYGNLVAQRRSGTSWWHHFDALGSTERLVGSDGATGVRYLSTAFGLPTVLAGSSANPYTWNGRLQYRWEAFASEYAVRRRRVSPGRGRWLSRDPRTHGREPDASLVDPSPGGWYPYAGNQPVIQGDPSGMQPCLLPPEVPYELWLKYVQPRIEKECTDIAIRRGVRDYEATGRKPPITIRLFEEGNLVNPRLKHVTLCIYWVALPVVVGPAGRRECYFSVFHHELRQRSRWRWWWPPGWVEETYYEQEIDINAYKREFRASGYTPECRGRGNWTCRRSELWDIRDAASGIHEGI